MSWKDKIKKERPETKKKRFRISPLAIILTIAFVSIGMVILCLIGILPYQSLLAWITLAIVTIMLVLAYDKDKRAMKNQ